ncbi:conserved hypothetical protein [Tenacibaculum litopenaei]|uniref:Crp/Fnr family transcriptional regulator n=1 Tax=Tenacibaculum litopenaei TaxID=396016 RepID=UPI00389363A0
MNPCIRLFSKITRLTPEAIEALTKVGYEKYSVKKGAPLIRVHQGCQELFFIEEGLVKLRFFKDDKEFIMRFFKEGEAVTDLASFYGNTSDKYEIIALATTKAFAIPLQALEQLCTQHPSINTAYRKFMLMANLNMIQRISEMLEQDASIRYKNFSQQNAELLQRINLGDVASYLGITQVSLSRIRAK